MNAERKKILEMLVEGKITADEAEKLLDKLKGVSDARSEAAEAGVEAGAETKAGENGIKPRFIRILIDKPGQDQVNVRIPLAFARAGSNFLAVLPSRVRERLAEQGVDIGGFATMGAKEWAEAVEQMNIDIEKGDGRKVKIFCE
jgi:hypothetical protein